MRTVNRLPPPTQGMSDVYNLDFIMFTAPMSVLFPHRHLGGHGILLSRECNICAAEFRSVQYSSYISVDWKHVIFSLLGTWVLSTVPWCVVSPAVRILPVRCFVCCSAV